MKLNSEVQIKKWMNKLGSQMGTTNAMLNLASQIIGNGLNTLEVEFIKQSISSHYSNIEIIREDNGSITIELWQINKD
tara:strand:- start:194 stop:427 length:234 start_codon:yes stop_codon:yes gene_type:complete